MILPPLQEIQMLACTTVYRISKAEQHVQAFTLLELNLYFMYFYLLDCSQGTQMNWPGGETDVHPTLNLGLDTLAKAVMQYVKDLAADLPCEAQLQLVGTR